MAIPSPHRPGSVAPSAITRVVRAFARKADGATAVEFGLVAMPFLALIGAILQFGFLQLWAAQNLDFLLQKAVRNLFTGSFQNSNAGVADQATLLQNLKTVMCSPNGTPVVAAFKCTDVKLNVTVIASFSGGSAATPINSTNRTWNTGFESYSSAAACKLVVVTAAVAVPVFFNLMNAGVSSLADGSSVLISTAVFRTEPYQSAGGTTC